MRCGMSIPISASTSGRNRCWSEPSRLPRCARTLGSRNPEYDGYSGRYPCPARTLCRGGKDSARGAGRSAPHSRAGAPRHTGYDGRSGRHALEGRLEESEKLGREVLEKQRRVLGAENRHTIVSMDTLAATLGLEGRLVESQRLEGETIDLERRLYGPDHLGTLMSMANQADTLYLMGKYAEARQLLQQTFDIQRRVLAANHPETARTIYNLGCVAARNGKSDEAFSLLERAIDHLSPRTVPKVDNDPDLNSLHGDPRFAKLVAHATRRHVSDARCPL